MIGSDAENFAEPVRVPSFEGIEPAAPKPAGARPLVVVSQPIEEVRLMHKLIVTLALAGSLLASTTTAAADPGSNVCKRLRHAIATGTPISALPPRLLRRCFDHTAVRPRPVRPVRPSVRPVREIETRLAVEIRPAADSPAVQPVARDGR
jgi:hypothetical protein